MNFPIDAESLSKLREDNIPELARLDENGLHAAPGENFSEFRGRLEALCKKLACISNDLESSGSFRLQDDFVLKKENLIPEKILAEAAERTEALYKFAINWIPGFFLSKSLGMLWGGCAIYFPDEKFSIFLIRKNFAEKKRWFLYNRRELLSHELCHVARMPFGDRFSEEHFAYQTSENALRRYAGNLFQNDHDALFFLIPVMLLPLAQAFKLFVMQTMPLYPFWILAGIYPLFLIIRNQLCRNTVRRARNNMDKAGIKNIDAILFRTSSKEISEMAKLSEPENLNKYMKEKAAEELRWKIIEYRFIRENNSL